jgi:7tm Chemosensory receptor
LSDGDCGGKFNDGFFTVWLFYKAKKTSSLLHKIVNNDRTGELTMKIMLFSQQLMHRVPVFSCGLFTFDLELAFKVRSALLHQFLCMQIWI